MLATGTTRSLDLGEVDGRTFVGIASCGIDADANRIANRSRVVAATSSILCRVARAVAMAPAAFTITIDGGRPHTITGYTIAVANSSSYGGGMRLAPAARLDDGLLDIVVIAHMTKLRFLRLLPTVFWGGHVNHAGVEILQGRRSRSPPRDRSRSTPTGTPSPSCRRPSARCRSGPRTRPGQPRRAARAGPPSSPVGSMSTLDAKVLAARAVGQIARRAGRGGGTSLPGKVLTRLDPPPSNASPPSAARLRGHLGHQRQDDDGGDGGLGASARAIGLVHNRAGANMAGGVASTLSAAARRRGEIAGELGLFEIDEFWLDRVGRSCARAVLLANLFRDQLDRYGELDTIADRWAAMVAALPADTALALNADDPLIADLGRGGSESPTSGSRTASMATAEMQHASDSKHCRQCGAAYVYDAVYLGHLGVYRCPGCGLQRPEPTVAAERVDSARHPIGQLHAATPAGSSDVALPLPGLYNVYNALGAATLCLALGMTLAQVADGLDHVAAAFGRPQRIAVGDRSSGPADQEPGGPPTRSAHVAFESGELDLLGVLNDGMPMDGTSLGMGRGLRAWAAESGG